MLLKSDHILEIYGNGWNKISYIVQIYENRWGKKNCSLMEIYGNSWNKISYLVQIYDHIFLTLLYYGNGFS